MNCPYCAEEIKEEAVICGFCQRDIAVFKPILARISEMDGAILELRSAIDVRPGETATSTIHSAAIAITASIALATLTCWITWIYPDTLTGFFDKPLNFLSVASPLFGALWLGWRWPRLRASAYALLGVIPGFAGFVAWFLLQLYFRFHGGKTPAYPPDWIRNLIAYAVSAPIWSLAGGTIGARLRPPEPHTAEHGIAGSQTTANSQAMMIEVVKGVFLLLAATVTALLGKG